jgi:hypothetical protein
VDSRSQQDFLRTKSLMAASLHASSSAEGWKTEFGSGLQPRQTGTGKREQQGAEINGISSIAKTRGQPWLLAGLHHGGPAAKRASP